MKKRNLPLSMTCFSLGILLSFMITGQIFMAVLNGLHSYLSIIDDAYDPIPMKCPVIRSSSEGASASAIVPRNTGDEPIHYSISGRVDDYEAYQKMLPPMDLILHPGEEFNILQDLPEAGLGPSYLYVRIRAQAGDRRPFPSILPELAYEGRCGIAIVHFLGLSSLSILLLALGIHLIGSTLFFRHTYPRISSVVVRFIILLIALLAFIGPVLALLPFPQTDTLLFIYAPVVYLIPLLSFLILVILLSKMIISWLRNTSNRKKKS